jgi:hypothetical protein
VDKPDTVRDSGETGAPGEAVRSECDSKLGRGPGPMPRRRLGTGPVAATPKSLSPVIGPIPACRGSRVARELARFAAQYWDNPPAPPAR